MQPIQLPKHTLTSSRRPLQGSVMKAEGLLCKLDIGCSRSYCELYLLGL